MPTDYKGNQYVNQTEADRANADWNEQNYGKGGGGGGGGAMGGMAGGFLLIFIIGPIIAAKLIGWLWGLLLKLGFVGKIITTVLMVVAGPIIVFTPLFMAKELSRGIPETVQGILLLGSVFILPTWYYFWHYDTVKEMGASVFSNKIKNFTMFSWFGFIGGWIIGAISKGNTNTVAGVIFLIATVAGIIYYLLSTISYAREVERTKSFRFRWIGLAVSVGLTVLLLNVAQAVGTANRNAGYTEGTILEVVADGVSILAAADLESEKLLQVSKGETLTSTGTVTRVRGGKSYYTLVPVNYKGTNGWVISYQTKPNVTALPAKNKKQRQIAAEYASGTVLLVNTNGKIKLYEEANELSKVVKEFSNNGGEKLISNGEVLFHPISDWLGFISVDYKGTKGWIKEREVSPIMGIATVVSDKAEFRPNSTFDDKGDGIQNPVSHPVITLKKGDTFEVLSVRKDYADGVYNGKLGIIKSSDITVAKGR